jgi:capsular exopolysaccharide synthesis family protein
MLTFMGWAGVSAGIWMKVKPNYMAYSVLRFEPPSQAIFTATTNNETFDMFLKTQVQLITSANVLTAAATTPKSANLQRIREASDIVQELKKQIGVRILPETTLIEVSMTSPDAYETAVLVNAVVESYLATNEEWANSMTRNQIASLDGYLRNLQSQTEEIERQWKEIVANGDVNAQIISDERKARQNPTENAQASATIEEFKRIKSQVRELDFEIVENQAVLDTAKTSKDKAVPTTTPEADKKKIELIIKRRFQTDPEVMGLAEEIRKAKLKYDEALRLDRRGSDPATKKAKDKYESLDQKYTEMWESKSSSIREGLELDGPNALTPEREIADLTTKIDRLKAKRDALKKIANDLEISTKQNATDSVKIQLLLDQRSSLKLMQDAVQRRLEQLRFESRGETRVRKVNEATASNKPVSDKRLMFLAGTPIGVLGCVLGLIVLLEIRSGRVADPDVLSSRVKHEVFSIAPLPNLKPGEDMNGEKAEQRLARFVQSLDHLRVAICEGGTPGGEGRCVMITSATGGEGKTTLSAHLAARCANSGTSTLLIDADMRRASLGRLLDVPVGPGLGDVLGGDIDLDEALITVQAGGFHFLSAGTPGRDPSRVLKSNRLSELIARLRQTYDLVIIDTPPVLPVADALIMGRWADGAVMAARFDASRLPLVERANRQLALAGIPVLGVVVNGVRGQDASYGNYAYSYNYYPSKDEQAAGNPSA